MLSGWHGPRRSHDLPPPPFDADPAVDEHSEPPRRSSTESTPRPATAAPRFASSSQASEQDVNRTVLNATPDAPPSKRLGFFTEKLSSATAHAPVNLISTLHPSQLLHPHVHSRKESALSSTSSTPPLSSMASSSTLSNISKSHTSPSKASYGRTYDPKLVSREMHRLGNLTHLPAALAPPIAATPSVSSLSHPAPGAQAATTSATTTDPWGALHVHVLPLFNGEPLRIPIEDLNVLVRRHIQAVVSSYPSKALATLENDAAELIASGMVTLNAKLAGIDNEKLVARVVEIWGFFWDQVLTYVEGVLLPLQTDPLLSSLYRTPKTHHTTTPSRQTGKTSISSSMSSAFQISTYHIDVRNVALRSFRDKVILPLFSRLHARLAIPNRQDSFQETAAYQQPRLQQMLLVLTSLRRHRPPTFSLTAPAPQPSAGEAAVADLLRDVRAPQPQRDGRAQTIKLGPLSPLSRAPSFLSGGLPRDRRGRVAQKQMVYSIEGDDNIHGEDIQQQSSALPEGELPEIPRSPDAETTTSHTGAGGWGLGVGHEDGVKIADEEEEEPMDWDKAQAMVEDMLKITANIGDSNPKRIS